MQGHPVTQQQHSIYTDITQHLIQFNCISVLQLTSKFTESDMLMLALTFTFLPRLAAFLEWLPFLLSLLPKTAQLFPVKCQLCTFQHLTCCARSAGNTSHELQEKASMSAQVLGILTSNSFVA